MGTGRRPADRARTGVRDAPVWLASGKTIQGRDAPTSFGPVSYTIRRRANEVDASLDLPAAPALHLRLPAGIRITAVHVGRHLLRFDTRTGTIDISGRRGRFDLEGVLAARYG